MTPRPLLVAVCVMCAIVVTGPGFVALSRAQGDALTAPTDPIEAPSVSPTVPLTPARASYVVGEVSFLRPGAADWAPARINTPLAPGDVFYTGASGHVEIQIGARAFVRAAENTQIGLDSQEPDFLQFRVIAGHAALDLRELPAGSTVELDTPGAAFTIERAGYYRVDVAETSVTFATHRGGRATVTPPGAAGIPIAANQQVRVTTEAGSPRVETGAAPPLTAWDRWNYERTAYLLQPTTTTANLPSGVYGTQELDRYGSWRVAESYGAVWTPSTVPAGWVPYSTGRWIWDPVYGWTWLDDAPWGWAPYHHGRWVFVGNAWAWAPGPRIARPVYSPALVVFLGGVSVRVGRPVAWAPLGWGEPLLPWWGRRGFIGVPWWGGWGGPRVVNNVVVSRTTLVPQVTVYRNVHVVNAVVGVPADRFGRGRVEPTRFDRSDVQRLSPVRGALAIDPVAASLAPARRSAPRPSPATDPRPIVATRPPSDVRPALRAHGLAAPPAGHRPAATTLVPSPARSGAPDRAAVVAPTPAAPSAPRHGAGSAPAARAPQRPGAAETSTPAPTRHEPPRGSGQSHVGRAPEASSRSGPAPSLNHPRVPEGASAERRANPVTSPPSPAPPTERAPRRDPPAPRGERPGRVEPSGRGERQDRSSRDHELKGAAARIPARTTADRRDRPPHGRLVYPHGAAH